MNLNSLNPFTWLQTILMWVGIFAIGLMTGAIGGCKYKQAQWDSEKVSQMEKAASQERKDRGTGEQKVEEFKADQGQIERARREADLRLSAKPTLVNCPSAPKVAKTVNTQSLEIKDESQPEKTIALDELPVTFSSEFVSLHDMLAQPKNSGLRSGINDASPAIEINAGFTIILDNYKICTSDQARLLRLQERIRDKIKNFGQE